MFAHIADKVSFVNYLPLLTQATVDDGDHTPGYLLGEIKNITYKSSSSSQQLAEYFAHRLNKSSTQVKVKILKIIIYLIENGHVSFRQGLRQNDGPIKNAVLHSGTPDPLLGKSHFKEVQRLAQETLDLLFDPSMMQQEEECGEVLSPLHPPKAFMGGMGADSKIMGKYEGFGNSPRDCEGTVADKMLDYLGRFMHSSEEEKHEAIRAALHSSPGNYQPVPVSGTGLEPVIPLSMPTQKMLFKKSHIPGKAGGGWESDDDDVLGRREAEVHSLTTSLEGFKPASPNPQDSDAARGCEETVENFCMIDGHPTVDELEEICMRIDTSLENWEKSGNFVFGQGSTAVLPGNKEKVCVSFNRGDVVSVLGNIFSVSQHSEQVVLRALLLTEWLQHCDPTVSQAFSPHFSELLDNLTGAKCDISQEIKTKAKKLSLIMYKVSLDETC